MSIKNIYTEITSFENLLQAEKDSRAGKRYETEQLQFWGDLEIDCELMNIRQIYTTIFMYMNQN